MSSFLCPRHLVKIKKKALKKITKKYNTVGTGPKIESNNCRGSKMLSLIGGRWI